MRQILNGVFAMTLATVVSTAYGDWPASKTYQADTGDPKLVTDADGDFLGWRISDQGGTWTQTLPGTIGGLPAEQDQTVNGKLKYSTDGSSWAFTPGVGVTTAIKWKIYISSDRTTNRMPAVQIGNGTTRFRLDFDPNVTDRAGCNLSGWTGSENTTIVSGGKRVPNSGTARYLPMSMDAWHTIRFQVGPNGSGGSKFDAWIDEEQGLSDWNHVSGTSTQSSGSAYVQWGVISTTSGTIPFATNYVAWGQGSEIGDLPFSEMELCGNGIDDDGDGNADCADSSCDCSPVPPECGGIADQIFERFNVYFTPDPVISGRVPPNWRRAGYSVPGYSDGDPTVPPGASLNDLAPYSANPGPYYFFNPGPYVNAENDPDIRNMVIDQCIEDCLAASPNNTQPYCENACNNLIPIGDLIRPTQPLRMTLDLWNVNPECIDKGGTNETCYAGSIMVERPGKVDDLATLPIDWTQPVTLSVDVGGIDFGTDDGHGGKWETAISYPGYAMQDASRSAIEWGDDSVTGNKNYGTVADYGTITLTLAPGQGTPAGPTILTLAANFDYTDLDLVNNRRQKICTAFFENVRISYLPDLTKPLIQLNKIKLRHSIDVGQAIPDDTFTITNGMSGTTLNYTATDDADWLTLVNGAGTSTGEADTVTVQYNTAGLANGIHTGTITVSWPGMDKSPATITVVLQVGPEIQLSTTALSHTVTMGKNVAPETFTVTNVGAGHLEYTISNDAGWLSVSPSSFTPPGLANGESNQITITYDTTSLLVGIHDATITVSDPDATPSSETINVRVVVTLARPDFDGDGDVDQADFAMFQACFSGTGIPATAGFCNDLADLNDDEYVDAADHALFEGCASGAGVPFNQNCLP